MRVKEIKKQEGQAEVQVPVSGSTLLRVCQRVTDEVKEHRLRHQTCFP